MRWSIGVLLLLGLASPALSQETLVWKFKEGTSFTLTRVHRQKQSVTFKGKTHQQESTMTWTTRIDVRKVAGLDIVLDQTILALTVAEGKPPVWMEKIKGCTFRITLTSAGRVRNFEGYEGLLKKLAEIKPAVRNLLSEATLRDSLEEMLGFLPAKGLAAAAGWQREAVEPIAPFGSLKTRLDYSLAGRQDGVDRIVYTVKAAYAPPGGDLGVLRVVKGALQADSGKGLVLFDPHTGLLIRGEQHVRIAGTLTLETAPGQTDDMSFVSDTQLTWKMAPLAKDR